MNILVIDDHALIREALRGVLGELNAQLSISEAGDWRQAALRLEQERFDLVLLDLGLPDRDGFGALAEVRDRFPTVAVVVLSARHDRDSVARALDLGALGYIPKSASRDVMLGAFRLIMAGGIYIPPDILVHPHPFATAASPSAGGGGTTADLGLTERQREVLALMMQGRSNKAICRVLDVAEATVKNHVSAILRALNANNRTEAVLAAKSLGFEPKRGTP